MPKVTRSQTKIKSLHRQKLIETVEQSIDKMKTKLVNNIDRYERSDKYEEVLAKMNHAVDRNISSFTNVRHKTVDLLYKGRYLIPIDENIAPLIKEIWKSGINTCNSCENNKLDHVWIEFASMSDFDKFIQIVFTKRDFSNKEFRDFIFRLENHHSAAQADRWWIELLFDDNCYDPILEATRGICTHVEISVSVRFPQTDYQHIYDRFVEHNTRRK